MRCMRARRIVGIILLAAVGLTATARDSDRFSYDHGGVVRGDPSKKQNALVFTGGDYGEGTAPILEVLRRVHTSAGFFVTGAYLSRPEQRELRRRAVREGHYVGPHSDTHPLYCSWGDREHTLISEQEFRQDLQRNIAGLRKLGALQSNPVYFIPPYEWFNHDQVRWARELGLVLFNYSPGSGSNRDYLPESDGRFVSSQQIYDDILAYEKKDPAGLNGFILLLHLGADRKDKMFNLLEPLLTDLCRRGYELVRIDRMLAGAR
jgi:peptidoglycan/xylan/chitin deacetylase (PgdA/CDA1 family)